MEIQEGLLKSKKITLTHKVILSIILDQEVPSMKLPCELTCGEIGKLVGLSRKTITDIFWELDELGLINTVVADRARKTFVKPLLKRILKQE